MVSILCLCPGHSLALGTQRSPSSSLGRGRAQGHLAGPVTPRVPPRLSALLAVLLEPQGHGHTMSPELLLRKELSLPCQNTERSPRTAA